MATIRITEETMAAIRRAAIYDFHQTGRRQTDGTWLVEVSEAVAERIAEVAQSGETIDDTIQRIIRQSRGGRPN
jgi:hypothetical protein